MHNNSFCLILFLSTYILLFEWTLIIIAQKNKDRYVQLIFVKWHRKLKRCFSFISRCINLIPDPIGSFWISDDIRVWKPVNIPTDGLCRKPLLKADGLFYSQSDFSQSFLSIWYRDATMTIIHRFNDNRFISNR